jgi:hypothetical protein
MAFRDEAAEVKTRAKRCYTIALANLLHTMCIYTKARAAWND